jgi:hypothetical protein
MASLEHVHCIPHRITVAKDGTVSWEADRSLRPVKWSAAGSLFGQMGRAGWSQACRS